MTICIAAIFRWNYAAVDSPNRNPGPAAIVLTDRMITAGDVQYEPQQTKIAYVTPRVMIVIAGDYSLHSQAIKKAVHHFASEKNASPEDVASIYAKTIQETKRKEAESIYLAPLGLDLMSFLARQKDMAPQIAAEISAQLQAYQGDHVEALIVGSHCQNVDIYGVDSRGIVACYNDVGFAAIGTGAWHARSRLMGVGYTHMTPFSPALCTTFAVKKASETAPGVGSNTDITLVFDNRIETLRQDVANKLHELYVEYRPKITLLENDYIERLQAFISTPTEAQFPGATAQAEHRIDPPAVESSSPQNG